MTMSTHRLPVNGNEHSDRILCLPPLAVCSIVTITVSEKTGNRDISQQRCNHQSCIQCGNLSLISIIQEILQEIFIQSCNQSHMQSCDQSFKQIFVQSLKQFFIQSSNNKIFSKMRFEPLLPPLPTRSMAPPMPLTILPGIIQLARSPFWATCKSNN